MAGSIDDSPLSTFLTNISDFMWRKSNVAWGADSTPENAFFFDWRIADEETLEYLQDTFDDLQPEELNLEHVIPFAVLSPSDHFECTDEEYKEGVFHWGQFSAMLFVNLKEDCAIYYVEIDGNIYSESYKKIANTVAELTVGLGAIESE